MALALDIAHRDPKASEAASAYLQHHAALVAKQEQLLDLQLHHFKEDRRSANQAAKRKRYADRLRNALQTAVGLATLGCAVAVVVTAYGAFTSRAVVVEAFDVPPAVEPRGISGKQVAAAVLDSLQNLTAATRAQEQGLQTKGAWSSDIKIDVPATGISIGEIDRLLHRRFGNDLHVSGGLVQTQNDGLELTVRGDGVPPKTFAGSASDLARLTRQAAEYIYGSSQPQQYAAYLLDENRAGDLLAFLPGAYARATNDVQRSRLADAWGQAYWGLDQIRQAEEKTRLAILLDPHNWSARSNLVGILAFSQGEEASWRAAQAFLRDAAAAPAGDQPAKDAHGMAAGGAVNSWDLPMALEGLTADSNLNGGAGDMNISAATAIADVYGLMHDAASASRFMAASDPNDAFTKAEAGLLQFYAALNRNDPAAAVAPMEALWREWQSNSYMRATFPSSPCYLAWAYGMTGKLPDAEAIFSKAGPWNLCYALHGAVLAHAGDTAGADRVWQEGQHRAPDLPWVYLHRGLAEAAAGATASAEADFAAANRVAPHYADPLKAWGDVLASQGKWGAALGKYRQALAYAPNWAALNDAVARAAQRAGGAP
jgi:tetratricopeptide (TPR) repeat protein